jgi:hypothetical protein
MTDPRLAAFLVLAQKRQHPYYAAGAYTLARQLGDTAAMAQALALGAANYRPEPPIRMRTDEEPKEQPQITIVQLRLFEEAA